MEQSEQHTNGMDSETEGPRGVNVDGVVRAVLEGQRITVTCEYGYERQVGDRLVKDKPVSLQTTFPLSAV